MPAELTKPNSTQEKRRREEYPVGHLCRESRKLKRDREKAGEHGLGAADSSPSVRVRRKTPLPVMRMLVRLEAAHGLCREARWYHEIFIPSLRL